MQRLAVLCLGLKDATVDGARVGRHRSGRLAGLLALGEDLLDVVVVFVHAVILQGQRRGLGQLVDSASVVHPHRCLQGVVGVQVVVCVQRLASDAAVTSKTENSGADGRPLRFGQGDGAEVKGENVGAGHRLSVVDAVSLRGQVGDCSRRGPPYKMPQSDGADGFGW